MVDKKEEDRLVRAFKRGDREAGDALLKMHEGVIHDRAFEICKNDCQIDDYLQEGRIGFLSAVKAYYPESKLRLVTFVSNAARWQMIRFRNSFSTVRVPEPYYMNKMKNKKYLLARDLSRGVKSLDAGCDKRREILEIQVLDKEPPLSFLSEESAKALCESLRFLSDEMRFIIRRRLDGLPFWRIGKEMQLSQPCVGVKCAEAQRILKDLVEMVIDRNRFGFPLKDLT